MENNHIPTKAQVQKVIDVLTIALNYSNALDMQESHLCGTTLCHGGHYAIACGISKENNFYAGADLLSEDLGFLDINYLENWAKDNSEIWGNEKGEYMFSDEEAFYSSSRPLGAKYLLDIIDHWKEVRERLPI